MKHALRTKFIAIMSAFFILISASLLIAVGFLIAFIYSAKNGQFDDSYTPSIRMLFDDKKPNTKKDINNSQTEK